MFGNRAFALFGALLSVLTQITAAPAPLPVPQSSSGSGYSSYWLSSIQRQGTVAFGGDSSYKVFRSVKDYGAAGDGSTDDTAAINKAISDGNRCGLGCNSTTLTPALVYFPPGTYVVSKPIIQYYYTQLVGDAISIPTIKASAGFQGMAVIDSDPYESDGSNWYTNQNNFFRQVRNFVIDLTAMPENEGAGIHWQVAQATSLQNIVFNMVKGAGSKQIGIFMDNGSGGFMSDLTFNGGNYAAFLGNQQYTTRNWTINDANTAIFMNWNWGWTLKSITINNCGVALDMANDPSNQTVGSVILMDSKITGTQVGVNSSFTSNSIPATGGTLVLDNVDMTGVKTAVQANGASVLAGGSIIKSWTSGRGYTGSKGARVEGAQTAPQKPAALLTSSGAVFERSKPQYEGLPASAFVSAKSSGCKGDGQTDDTQAIQSFLNGIKTGQVAYFDHGAYIVTSTIKVPTNIMITGEIWPLIMASGKYFSDASNPKPVFQIGSTGGQTGAVELSDLIFETKGSTPGAIMIEWNINSQQGQSGMWDTHVRIGGSAGTGLQADTCTMNPAQTSANTACEGAFLLFHATPQSGGVYLENTWFWVADHELDQAPNNQISLYNGRGMLIESQGAVWLYGTSVEHSVLYNYQFSGVKALFSGFMQSETPYMQPNPMSSSPFTFNSAYDDPTFAICTGHESSPCKDAWGLRILHSEGVLVYGAGLYSFFENYDQTCVSGQNCQEYMIHIIDSQVSMFAVSTKAAVNMIFEDGVGSVLDADNRSNFCGTIAFYTQ